VGFVRDATSTLNASSRFYAPEAGSRDTDVEESNRNDNNNAHAAKTGTKNRNKISSATGGSTKSPTPASTPSSSSSSSRASEYCEFYTEPDLQMTRANWWQDLVTIYHPNAEIGNKLVMADVVHL
jgi:hypothetical protein